MVSTKQVICSHSLNLTLSHFKALLFPMVVQMVHIILHQQRGGVEVMVYVHSSVMLLAYACTGHIFTSIF